MSSCRSTSRLRALALAPAVLAAVACSSEEEVDPTQDILHGTIAYPFVDESQPIGTEPPDDKFIIKSAVGGTEYVVQIPGGARDYDVQVPLADLGVGSTDVATAAQKSGANPVQTDKEIVSSLPQLKKERPSDTALLDGAFGTGEAEGPKQAPSYTLGIARINEHYKKRNYELALIELNNLLAFYPNSPQIHKMKGTVLLKMRNLPLAELAWIKALELSPGDKALQRALERLQKRIVQQGKAKNITGPGQPYEIPQPLGTTPPKKEDALAH